MTSNKSWGLYVVDLLCGAVIGGAIVFASIPPAPVCYISADDVKTPQQVVDDTPAPPPLRLGGVK